MNQELTHFDTLLEFQGIINQYLLNQEANHHSLDHESKLDPLLQVVFHHYGCPQDLPQENL